MSKSIDEKVVEMKFDNRNFENNVQESLSTLDKLKKSLEMKNVTNGLENVEKTANRISFNNLSNSLENIQNRMSHFSMTVQHQINRLADGITGAATRMVKALTIDPISTGLDEYETKMDAIQTIMSNTASKGKTMDDVTKVLGELNTYADKTIYNFAQMTRNIGTFTAAGVGLEEAASAIQGIANLAAASGSNSQQASTAMYQLSQALAAGTVKLQDWNSVVNAGMGGEKFQEALKQTAREHGIAVDQIIKQEGSFRESLSEGWISAEILNETLRKFTVEGAKDYARSMMESGQWTQAQADALIKEAQAMEDAATKVKTFTQLWDTLKEAAQSGWSESWELIIGNFEEAKEFFSEISDTIGGILDQSAKNRNAILKDWKTLGGRTAIIDSLRNVFLSISSIIQPIAQAFREIFPPITGKQLASFSEGIKELTSRLILSESAAKKLHDIFKGIFSVVSIITKVFATLGTILLKVFTMIGSVLGALGKSIFNISAHYSKFITKMNDSLSTSEKVKIVLDKITTAVNNATEKVKEFSKNLSNKITTTGIDSIHNAFIKVKDIVDRLINKVKELYNKIAPKVVSAFKIIAEAFKETFSFDDVLGGMKMANSTIFSLLLIKITDFINSLAGITKNVSGTIGGLKGITDGIKGVLNGVKDVLKAYQSEIKADAIKTIAISIAILAGSLFLLSLLDSEKLTTALFSVGGLFAALIYTFKAMETIKGGQMTSTLKMVATMTAISVSILVLAHALTKIASIGWKDLLKGLTGVAATMAILVTGLKVLSDEKPTELMKGVGTILAMTIAIKALASACISLSGLSWGGLAKGLLGVIGLMTTLVIFSKKLVGDDLQMIEGAVGLGIMALALEILADVANKYGNLGWEALGKAAAATAVILGLAASFTMLSKYTSGMIEASVGLTIMAGALTIMAHVASKFGELNWESLGKAGAAMGGILALALAFGALSQYTGQMLASTAALIVMGVALEIMAHVIKQFGELDWESLGKAGAAVTGILVFALALAALGELAPNILMASAALAAMAISLKIIIPVLETLGSLNLAALGIAGLALAGMFTILGLAALALTPVVPVLLSLSAAIALLGAGMVGIGIGLTAFSTGLAALAVSGVAGAKALLTIIETLATGIIGLLPTIFKAIGEGIIGICKVIIEAVPTIAETIVTVFKSIISVLSECIPYVIEYAFTLITAFITALSENLPTIVEAGMKIILALLNGINEHFDEILTVAFELMTKFLNGLVENLPTIIQSGIDILMAFLSGIRDNLGNVASMATDIIIELINAIGENLPRLVQAGVDLIITLINGLSKGIEDNSEAVRNAMIGLCESILNAVLTFFGIHSPSTVFMDIGVNLIEGLVNGIKSMMEDPIGTLETLGSTLVEKIGEKGSDFLEKGKTLITRLREGMSEKYDDVKSTVVDTVKKSATTIGERSVEYKDKGIELIEKLKDGMNNTVDVVLSEARSIMSQAANAMSEKISSFVDIGANMVSGLANGIRNFSSGVIEAAKSVAQSAIDGAKNVLDIHSPSRVFYKMGEFTVQGYVNALHDNADNVLNSTKVIGDYATKGMNSAINKMSEMLEGSVNNEPVIKPVLDLSDIQYGATTIGDMFDSIGIDSNLNAIGYGMNTRIQNVNEDILMAINKLRDDFSGTGGNTYNINGITYDDGSNITDAVKSLIRAANIERRV